jgi:cyanophycinase
MPDTQNAQNANAASGALMIIGGAEDRTDNKAILGRFVALASGAERPLVVLTAASKMPDQVWELYRTALADLGAGNVRHIPIADRADADDAATADLVAGAGGIFMTGGDQKRLVAHLGGTRVEQAMREAYNERGACIAGTSAGASALCTHMLAEGKAELAPEKGAVRLGAGLGFVPRVIIDQHFSQRHRINRLLGVVAQNPFLLGAGIDEDTALVVHGRAGIAVIGEGTVTVLDCRSARSNIADLPAGAVPTLVGVGLHLLPSGTVFTRSPDDGAQHELADLLDFLTVTSGVTSGVRSSIATRCEP